MVTSPGALLVAARFRPYRFLGWSYIVAFTIFVALKGKNYYLGPIYPVYLAAGAVVIDSAIERLRQPWLKPMIAVVFLVALVWPRVLSLGSLHEAGEGRA